MVPKTNFSAIMFTNSSFQKVKSFHSTIKRGKMQWVKEKKVNNLTSETTVISFKSKSSPNTQSCFTELKKNREFL